MKRHLIATLILIGCLAADVYGQKEKDLTSPTSQYLRRRGYVFPTADHPNPNQQWPDTLYYNTAYKAKLLGTPTIPVSFSRVEYANGSYQITPTVSLGYGYAWFIGEFIFNENDKILVDPKLFFGLVADVSLQNDFNLSKPAGFFTGGFIGVTGFSLYFGYDFVTTSPTLGLGGRIDVYTLRQKSLKPFGKVREVRPHKRAAPVITNE